MNPSHIRILRRPTHQVNPLDADNSKSATPAKTLEQREAEYAAARRRIMGSESEDPSTVSDSSEVTASDTTSSESVLASKTTPDDQENKNSTTPIKPSHTAIPLMSIPTAALSIPLSLDRSPQINLRSGNLATQPTGSSNLPTCVTSTTCQLPAFVSNMSSPHQQSASALSSDSLLPGYSNIPQMFPNFNIMPQSSQNTVGDVMQQPQPNHPSRLKAGVPINMVHPYNIMRQYNQTLAASQMNMQSHPALVQPVYQTTCQRETCNQMQNLMPSLQFRSAPPRFTYSSGYN